MVGKHPLGSFYRLRYLNLRRISLLLIGPKIFFHSNIFFFLKKKIKGKEGKGATNCVCHFLFVSFVLEFKENSFCAVMNDITIIQVLRCKYFTLISQGPVCLAKFVVSF